jgi:hypothetical protein
MDAQDGAQWSVAHTGCLKNKPDSIKPSQRQSYTIYPNSALVRKWMFELNVQVSVQLEAEFRAICPGELTVRNLT